MKDYLPYIIILCLIYFWYETEPKVEIKTEYKQGTIDTLYVRDTVPYEVPVDVIKYETVRDTIRDTVFTAIKSSFTDTTERYAIEVHAFSLLPVDSFSYNIDLFISDKIITRVDTLKITETETIEETNLTNIGLAVVLGYLLGVL